MGSASLRTSRVLALSLAAVVGTMTLAATPLLAAPGTGPVAAENIPAPDVNAGEAYTQFIVSFKKTPGNATPDGRANAWGKAAKQQGVSVRELRALATGATLIASDKALSDQAAKDFMDGIVASGAVNAVEPDARMTAVLTPNDTRYGEQWDFTGANGMRIPGAWDVSTGSGSTVAVIDTGITAHPDLDANVLPGYDFVSDATAARDGNGRDSNAQDQGDWYAAGECGQTTAGNSSWHGTHVSGTIAAVTGPARAAGVTLAVSCDCIVMADDADLSYPEINVGVIPAMHFVHLPRQIGRHQAFELLFTGDTITAKQAEARGLINRAVPRADVMTEARKLAQKFAAQSPVVMKLARDGFMRANDNDYRRAIENVVETICNIIETDDAQEGLNAFNEKRKPNW